MSWKEGRGWINNVFFRLHKNQNVKLYGSKNLEEGAGTENMYSIHQLRCLCCQIPDVFKMLLLSEYQFDLLFEYKICYLFPWWPKQKRNSWYNSRLPNFPHMCVSKRKKSHTMIIPMNFFLSFWPMHICIIFSFLLQTQINWLISKRCCLRLSIVWLLRFFKSSFLHRLWFSFEYIISFLCWEHIKKVSWTFSFRNQKCISWIPIVLDFGRLKRWRLNWMHWKWYGCHNVLEFQTNKEFWDHFQLKSLNISLIFCIYQYFL